MLDFIGTIIITAVIVTNISAVASALPVARAGRLAVALAVGLWIGLAASAGASGLMSVSQPVPLVGLFVALPLLGIGALAALSPGLRTALLGLPTPLLVGLNVSRAFGALFLVLAAEGRLSGPFPVSAGWGDIAVGALALPALWLALRPSRLAQSAVAAWNKFGALDLIVAVALGVTSAQGSPLQLFDVGAGSSAMQVLPRSLVPSVLVPLYLIMHAILFFQLRDAARPHRTDRLIPKAA